MRKANIDGASGVLRWYEHGMADTADEFLAVNLRLPMSVARRLDEYVAARNAAGDGARISRNSAIAVLLEKALDQVEPRAKTKKVASR